MVFLASKSKRYPIYLVIIYSVNSIYTKIQLSNNLFIRQLETICRYKEPKFNCRNVTIPVHLINQTVASSR